MATWTQADIDVLKAAIKGGVLTVRFGDRSITYQSLPEMRKLLADMQAEVNISSGGKPYRLGAVRKGA